MNSCAFCGRLNDAESRFCIDCGKPLSPSDARVVSAGSGSVPSSGAAQLSGAKSGSVSQGGSAASRGVAAPSVVPPTRVQPAASPGKAPCPFCGTPIDPTLPFCANCGKRTGPAQGSGPACPSCGNPVTPGVDAFCPRCGTRLDTQVRPSGTQVLTAGNRESLPKLALLDDAGEVTKTYNVDKLELTVGRGDGDIRFPDDVYMSPIHALFTSREGQLWVRDLGSRNGTWVFLDAPCRLADGDIVLVGSQLLRFRRLGYPGPHPPEADATRRLGSLVPSADVAVLQQLRADGSVRDSLHLSPGRVVSLGRELGDWVFAYDQTMSGRHAEIRSEDSEFVVHDTGSRNGVAVAVRGERSLRKGQRVLLGDQILRVESV